MLFRNPAIINHARSLGEQKIKNARHIGLLAASREPEVRAEANDEMKPIGLLISSVFVFALMGFAAEDRDNDRNEIRRDAQKVARDQRYIDREKRQMRRAAANGNFDKAARKHRNVQVGKAKRAKDVHELHEDVQDRK